MIGGYESIYPSFSWINVLTNQTSIELSRYFLSTLGWDHPFPSAPLSQKPSGTAAGPRHPWSVARCPTFGRKRCAGFWAKRSLGLMMFDVGQSYKPTQNDTTFKKNLVSSLVQMVPLLSNFPVLRTCARGENPQTFHQLIGGWKTPELVHQLHRNTHLTTTHPIFFGTATIHTLW